MLTPRQVRLAPEHSSREKGEAVGELDHGQATCPTRSLSRSTSDHRGSRTSTGLRNQSLQIRAAPIALARGWVRAGSRARPLPLDSTTGPLADSHPRRSR